MGRRRSKNKKVSRKLKQFSGRAFAKSGQRTQRVLSGRSGAWFLEPSGDLHELEPQECLKSARTGREENLSRIEDSNDEFERDPVGF